MVMSRRRMHQKDAIILAGLLGGVLLLLFSPLWGPMIWRAPASFSEPVAVSGQATKKEEKKEGRRKGDFPPYCHVHFGDRFPLLGALYRRLCLSGH